MLERAEHRETLMWCRQLNLQLTRDPGKDEMSGLGVRTPVLDIYRFYLLVGFVIKLMFYLPWWWRGHILEVSSRARQRLSVCLKIGLDCQ